MNKMTTTLQTSQKSTRQKLIIGLAGTVFAFTHLTGCAIFAKVSQSSGPSRPSGAASTDITAKAFDAEYPAHVEFSKRPEKLTEKEGLFQGTVQLTAQCQRIRVTPMERETETSREARWWPWIPVGVSAFYGAVLAGFGASAQSSVPAESPAAGPDEIRGSDSRSILPNYGPAFITLAPAALLTLPWLFSSIDTSSIEYAPPKTSALNKRVPCSIDGKRIPMTIRTGFGTNLNSSDSIIIQNNQISLDGKNLLKELFSLSPAPANRKWKNSPWLVSYLHEKKPNKSSRGRNNRGTRGPKLPWVKIGFAKPVSCVSPQHNRSEQFCVNWSDYPSANAIIKKHRTQYWRDYLLKNWASHYTSVSSYMTENSEAKAQNVRVLKDIHSALSSDEKLAENKNIDLATMTLDAISYLALRGPKTRLSALEKYVVSRALKVAEEPKSQYFKKTEDLYRDKLLKKRSYVKYYAYFKNIDKDADKYREPAIKQLRSRYRTESRQKRINNDRLKKLVNQIVLLAGEKSKAARAIKEDHATLYQRRAKAQREADRRHQQSQAKKTEALKCIIGYRYQKCAGRIRHDLVRCKENSVRECCAKFGMRRSADFTGCR